MSSSVENCSSYHHSKDYRVEKRRLSCEFLGVKLAALGDGLNKNGDNE